MPVDYRLRLVSANVRRVVEYLLGNVLLVTLALSVRITRAQEQPLTQPTMTLESAGHSATASERELARGGAFRCDTARRRERTMRTEPCSPARKVSTDRGIQNRCLTLCDRHRCPPDPLSLRPGALVLVCAGGDQRLAHACRGARGRPGQIWMCSSERSIAIASADRSPPDTHCMLCSCRLLSQRL